MCKHQIGKIIKIYIDDTLVESLSVEDHLTHLQEIFDILKKFNMNLNQEKYDFGVGFRKLLGFLVLRRGIEVNPKKIKIIEDIPEQLKNIKEGANFDQQVSGP